VGMNASSVPLLMLSEKFAKLCTAFKMWAGRKKIHALIIVTTRDVTIDKVLSCNKL